MLKRRPMATLDCFANPVRQSMKSIQPKQLYVAQSMTTAATTSHVVTNDHALRDRVLSC
jgi:hypothetical protein